MTKYLTLALVLLMACDPPTSKYRNAQKNETESAPMIIKEELPPLKTCSFDKGKLKVNRDGNSIAKSNEMTEMLRLLKQADCDIVEVSWIWVSTSGYPDMPKKLVYNSRTNELLDIYTQTNVIERFNNVSKDHLINLLSQGSNDYYTLGEYEFDTSQMKQTALGEKPKQSELDGSVDIVEKYVKDHATDASSISFLEWTKVIDSGESWALRAKYKGTNSFGATVTENAWFYIQNGKVVNVKPIQ